MIKTLRIVAVVVAVLAGLFLVDRGIVPLISSNNDEAIAQKQFNELVMPIVRIKGGVELPDGRQARWTGSGVIVYSKANAANSGFDTYLLTCNHVVERPVFAADNSSPNDGWGPKISGWTYGVDYVEIFNPDGSSRKVQGYVVAQSNNNIFDMNEDGDLVVKTGGDEKDEFGLTPGEDLALVRLETTEKLPTVKMMPRANIDKLRRFFGARVVGCSLGGRPYNTSGEITVLQDDYMSVSAQFVPGNSGGAAYLDKTHEFLGITNAGPNGVWHMGIIRPLKRIYDWMDKTGHTFIYDSSASAAATLASDFDAHIAAEKEEKDSLKKDVAYLKQAMRALAIAASEQVTKAADLQKEVDFLLLTVATLRTTIIYTSQDTQTLRETVSRILKSLGKRDYFGEGYSFPPPPPGGPFCPPDSL